MMNAGILKSTRVGTGVYWHLVKRLSLFTIFLGFFLLVFSVEAAERSDFRDFSIELSEGWELQVEARYRQDGVSAAFASGKSGKARFLIVNVVSSMGKSMDELVADARAKADARDAFLEVVEQTEDRSVFNSELRGYQARVIIVLDQESRTLAILTMTRECQEAESIARTIVPVNPKLRFFE